MTQVVGFIKDVKVREGTSKQGKPWKGYTLVLESKEGADLGFFSFGFDPPKARPGDYVQFDAEPSARSPGNTDVVKGSLKVAAAPPARTAVAAAVAASTPAGQTPDTRQAIIGYQSARNAAIALVDVLERAKALPISGASTKAGDAKRFEEIQAIVDKLTVRFHVDAQTLRVLESVQDEGDEIDESAGVEATEVDVADCSDLEDPGFK